MKTMVNNVSKLQGQVFAALLALSTIFSPALLAQTEKTGGADTIKTDQGDLVIHPINHATTVLEWNGKTIYMDPVGAEKRYLGLPKPDLILITDVHGDHLDPKTLKTIVQDKTKIVAPAAVQDTLSEDLKKKTTIISNGENGTVEGIKIEAIPMYNLDPARTKYHSKGRGNGYVLTLGGKRIYFSGDTEDIPEMRSLKNIDVAFVCMNLPYTMTVDQAASAVKEFKPKIVYPYHYRGSDTDKFKSLVGQDSGVEVRLRDWYGDKK
jgi:L-ascorbate metabolism protein UlaG (beta-lactamase superfamily)